MNAAIAFFAAAATLAVLIFATCHAGVRFIQFCDDNDDRWWGGRSLWMAGAIGFLSPALVGSFAASALVFKAIYEVAK